MAFKTPLPNPGSPMSLPAKFNGTSSDYQKWKNERLQLADQFQAHTAAKIIAPTLECAATPAVLEQICKQVRDHGYALYEWAETPEDVTASVSKLHQQLALTQHDQGVVSDAAGLSLLTDLTGSPRGKFIPYTSRAMGWHTDGYYNDQMQILRCFTLHCISPAAAGGALSLLDNELLFIALMNENSEIVELLSHPEAMTLPANKDDVGHNRPDRYASVFFSHSDGTLGTRFTTRTKNIEWRTKDTKDAAGRAVEILAELSQWHHTLRLESGQGLITRNILHKREAFTDDSKIAPRQMLRGRYLQLPSV